MAESLRNAPEASFERAWAAFDGAPEDFAGYSARLVIGVVAASIGADTTIDRHGLCVLWPHRPAPFDYLPALGPAVIAALRAHAPGRSFDVAFNLDKQTLDRICLFKPQTAMRFWVTRQADRITIQSRAATLENAAASIPQPLAPWSSSKVFATFDPPRRCVHCGVFPDRFRYFEDVLICLACGRSQRLQPQEIQRATLQTEVESFV